MNSIDIRKFREEFQLTQKQLSTIAGVTIRAVQSWEQNKRNMPQSSIMLLSKYKQEHTNNHYIQQETKINLVQENNSDIYKKIPLVEVKAVGGFGGSDFSIENKDIKDYYVIPKFKHKQIDFMLEVEGSSMYPKYSSGDVVACTVIKESSFIQWNKTHVIATKSQGIIIKRIKQGSEGNLLMVSDNTSYDPFEVPVDDITGIAIVAGVIRLE